MAGWQECSRTHMVKLTSWLIDEIWHDEAEDVEAVLSQIKAHPGNVSLNSLLDENAELKQVRALAVPADAFARIGPQVIDALKLIERHKDFGLVTRPRGPRPSRPRPRPRSRGHPRSPPRPAVSPRQGRRGGGPGG